MRTEQDIQAKIIKRHELLGWYVIKLAKTNKTGIPDLICLKPDDVLFIEVKRPNGVLSKIQEYRIKTLRAIGFKVEVMNE